MDSEASLYSKSVLLLLLLLNFLLSFSLFAQQTKSEFRKVYLAKVYTTNHHKIINGILYSVSDTTLTIQRRIHHQDVWQEISYLEIKKISIRKKGGGRIGFAVGAGASIAVGLIHAERVTDEEDGDFDRSVD